MEYRCISADCHIDLCWLPHDLFVANASKALQNRMPFVAAGPDGPMWTTRTGADLGLANSANTPAAAGAGVYRFAPGKVHRFDRMATTGLYADAVKGIFRPTTPEYRIQDQDRDGIQAEVLYGLLGSGNKLADGEARAEFYRIYNDWLVDFCNYDRTRLVGLASIPSHNVEAAVAETRRVAKLGLGGLDFSVTWDMIPLSNPYWDPFWKVAAETNLPVHFHTVHARPDAPMPDNLSEAYREDAIFKVASKATRSTSFQLYMANILGSVILGGALERFPGLRIVLGESGIGWIPYVLVRMDYEFEYRLKGKGLDLTMKPSDYWRRQCRATFQDDPIGVKLLDDVGIDNVMWASDYPHGDSVFPDSQEYIANQFSQLPGAAQRKIICENAGRFYGLIAA